MEKFFAQNDDFCGGCGVILPLPTFAPSKLVCESCGCQWTVNEKRAEIVYVREKIYEKTVLESNAPAEDDEGGAAAVEHVCSKCEYNFGIVFNVYIFHFQQIHF
uniref:DNA-directed RNA polymerase M/15kDa subunit domain-containing protein n=1 Tax=Panagrolaimus sp. ES5 TaxID=591445 RepID=A0AC34F2R8_9BILA